MSYLWIETEKWKSPLQKENCPVCQNLPQPDDYVTIAETDASWIEAHPEVPLRGTCYVMSKMHAVELFDLSDEGAFAFLKDVMMTAKALKYVTGAEKINYEIHGNTVPHLHMHLYPRYLENDQFRNGPIDPSKIKNPVYLGDEFSKYIEAMRETLSSALP